MARIMTIGEILVEIMATERGQSFRAPGALVGPFPSGAPAIFIDQVGRLGQSCGMIGCVGDDDFGWLNTEQLRRDGVDTSAIVQLADAVTGSAFVTYTVAGDRHFVFNIAHSAAGRLSASLVTEQVLADCAWLHVMGSSLFSSGIVEAVQKAIRMVKGRGGVISFDPNIRPEILKSGGMRDALRSVLQHTDVFLPSESEVALLVDAASESEAIDRLLALGIREVVVKRGSAGCTYFDGSSRLDVPGFAVQEVDPTGAGDCFCGTYVVCRDAGKDIVRTLRYACASGALAVTRKGPMEGTASFAELDALLGMTSSGEGSGRA